MLLPRPTLLIILSLILLLLMLLLLMLLLLILPLRILMLLVVFLLIIHLLVLLLLIGCMRFPWNTKGKGGVNCGISVGATFAGLTMDHARVSDRMCPHCREGKQICAGHIGLVRHGR